LGGIGAGAEAGDVEAVDSGDEFFEAFVEVGAVDGVGLGVEDEVEGLVEEFAGADEVTGLKEFAPLFKHAFGAAHALVFAGRLGGKGLAEERGNHSDGGRGFEGFTFFGIRCGTGGEGERLGLRGG
jgi:hypothetical protein